MTLLSLLAVEFVLGIYVNLYVSFPAHATGTSIMMGGMEIGGMRTVMNHVGLAFHMMFGFLLVAMGCATVILAVRTGIPTAMWLAAIGLAAFVGAGIAGMVFVMAGQANSASYVMAIGFLISFSSYFAELTVIRP